jgi:hypothetical protein
MPTASTAPIKRSDATRRGGREDGELMVDSRLLFDRRKTIEQGRKGSHEENPRDMPAATAVSECARLDA